MNPNIPAIQNALEHPTLARRFAAIFYDTLIIIGLLVTAEALLLAARMGKPVETGNPLHALYLLAVVIFFFGWFWTHGGQTAGMRAWRIRIQRPDGRKISWGMALLRFFAAGFSWACFGLGFLWSIFDSQRRTWHDMISASQLILIGQEK